MTKRTKSAIRECFDRFMERLDRREKCGQEGFPHDFTEKYIVVPPGLPKEDMDWIIKMYKGTPPYICKICDKASYRGNREV